MSWLQHFVPENKILTLLSLFSLTENEYALSNYSISPLLQLHKYIKIEFTIRISYITKPNYGAMKAIHQFKHWIKGPRPTFYWFRQDVKFWIVFYDILSFFMFG